MKKKKEKKEKLENKFILLENKLDSN